VLVGHWRLIALLVVISVLLGFVPTIKSELEAGLIDEISQTIRNSSSTDPLINAGSRPDSFLEAVGVVLSTRISRFERMNADKDLPERIAGLLFGRVGVGLALLFYLVLSIAAYSVDFLTTVFQTRISQEVFAKLRGIGLTKGLVTDPAQLPALTNTAGQYSNAIQVGAANVGNTYGYLLDAGQHLLSLGTALFLIFTKSPQFAVACLVVVLLQVWLSYVQGRRLRKKRNELDSRRNDLLARTDDVLSKRELILAYERQDDYRDKLDGYTKGYADVVRKLSIKEKLYSLMSRLITDYGRMIILLVGLLVTLGLARRAGSSQVTDIGDAYFFLSIYTRILFPATDLLRKYDSLKESESTSRTFLAVLSPETLTVGATSNIATMRSPVSNPPEDADEPGTAVTFRDVFFKYPVVSEGPSQTTDDEKWVLNGISFHIPARKTTLVLGRSGCGKTTIARILLGFWRPAKGEVTVFERALSEYSGDELRGLMAYVPQGDHIIDDSVKENLAWGYTKDGKGISDERMLDTLESLKIIRTEEERRNILTRFARELAGGQQQRLSFARMMLDESEIVILDEPFAGVDTFTIRDVRAQLTQIFDSSKRTVLMFSHRLAFAKFADHILIFGEDGKIIEEGSPSKLLADKNGEFTKLYNQARDDLEVQT
jgi:ABC-type multidrug transport system fused ATPase/permease subunit